MDKEQVLAAMKKNWLSITFGVAALIVIAVMIFVINPRLESLQSRVQERAAREQQITNLQTQQRPNIQAATRARQAENNLPMFPTEKVIQQGSGIMERVRLQSEDVLQQAVEVNRRLPLGVRSWDDAVERWPLEGPERTGARAEYRRQYMRWINAGNNFREDVGQYPDATLQAEVGATRPPTEQELESRWGQREAQLMAEAEDNQEARDQLRQELAAERVRFTNSLRQGRAQNGLMYIDPNSANTGFTVHPIATVEQPSAADCFNAQVGLWVQETVVFSLAWANRDMLQGQPSDRQNLLNAPVKHVMSITVPVSLVEGVGATTGEIEDSPQTGGLGARRQPGATGGAAIRGQQRRPAQEEEEAPADTAVELPTDPTADIQREFSVSPSGRPLHTPFYDTVQFNVLLRCDAAWVPYVLTELQRDSFLTVLKVDVTYVDLAQAAQQGYIYGGRPVLQLDLQCEMVFLRPWTAELMPASLRQALANLGGAPEAAGEDEWFDEF